MSGLTERLRAMLAETADERLRLETRRTELAAERDEKLDEVRRDYAERLAAIDADLSTARRIDRAINPPEPKPKREEAPAKVPRALQWKPKDEAMREVLAAIEAGAKTVGEITDGVSVSRGTVESAVAWLREEGLIRLSGTVGVGVSNVPAKTYRTTPQGRIQLHGPVLDEEALANGAHA